MMPARSPAGQTGGYALVRSPRSVPSHPHPRCPLLLATAVAAFGAASCDRSPKPTPSPAPSQSTSIATDDPLGSIPWSDAPIDWTRPVPRTPAGGVIQEGYVGSEVCKDCHKEVYASYARHSMARTGPRPLSSLDPRWLAKIFDAGATQPVIHEKSGFSYRAFRRGRDYFVEESVHDRDGAAVQTWVQRLTHAYSAGSYGVAFYFRQGERLYQVPIDYYPQPQRWGVDPAASTFNPRFTKSLGTFCISCHGDYPRAQAGIDDVFVEPLPSGVGCERCHGPGQKHAASLRPEDIVNPAQLSSARQLDVCVQCHESSHSMLRGGRDELSYRPGQPLGQYRISFVDDPPAPDRFALLAHPERMVQSACWRASGGKLVCTSCHDPHKSSFEQPASWWDSRCDQCHHDHPCTESAEARAAQQGHCVPCHMRAGSPTSPTLVTVTDHWIQRRPPPIRPGSEKPERLVAWPDLVREPATGDDLPALKALAYAGIGQREVADPLGASVAGKGLAVPQLYEWLASRYQADGQSVSAARAYEALFQFAPDDGPGLYGYARLMQARGPEGGPEATRALDRMLALDPDNPTALEMKGTLLLRSGRIEDARPLFARAAALGPSSSASHVALAVLARRQGRDADAIAELEAARRIEPADAWILDRLREGYVKAGDKAHAGEIDRARAYFVGPRGGVTTDATRWLPDTWR